jgi:hypothetical protein
VKVLNMSINRRTFFVRSATVAAGLATLPALATLEGCSTSWIATVEADIPEVVNIVSSVLGVLAMATGNGFLAPGLSAIISTAVSVAVASLNALNDAVTAYKAAGSAGTLSSVIAALEATQKDVQGVIAALPAGAVSITVNTIIVAAIGTAVVVLSSIQAIIPGAAPAAVTFRATSAAAATKPSLPNAAALRGGYNAVLMLHGYGQLALK